MLKKKKEKKKDRKMRRCNEQGEYIEVLLVIFVENNLLFQLTVLLTTYEEFEKFLLSISASLANEHSRTAVRCAIPVKSGITCAVSI